MKLALAALLTTLSACAVDPAAPNDPPGTEQQALGGSRCPSWGCGANSPTVGDGLLFDELDRSGATPNSSGIFVGTGTAPDGAFVKLAISRHELYAIAPATNRTYRHAALVGTIFQLSHPTYGTYEVLVHAVDEKNVRFWAGASEAVPAYELMTRHLGENQFAQYACHYDMIAPDPQWSGHEHHALVFEGDRYDPARKLVSDAPAGDPHFNIACAATAPAKLHLLRHTNAGAYTDAGIRAYPTTWKERQTMLKLLAADYCGTGTSFTVDGQPLLYRDTNPSYSSGSDYVLPEALWGPSGALCLDTPRRAAMVDVQNKCMAAGVTLPTCGSAFADWSTHAHAMSAITVWPAPPGPAVP